MPAVISARRLGHLSLLAPPIRSRDRASVSSFGASWKARLIRATGSNNQGTAQVATVQQPFQTTTAHRTTTRQIPLTRDTEAINCDSLRPTLPASHLAAQLLSASSHTASRHLTRLRIRPTQLSPTASPSSSTRRYSVAYLRPLPDRVPAA